MRRAPILLILANLMLITGLAIAFPDLMISPGKVTEGHQKVQRDCFACHTAFAGTPTSKCTGCHDPDQIGLASSERSNGVGVPALPADFSVSDDVTPPFHGALKDQTCTRCHTDHRGRTAATVRGPDFAHDLLTNARREDCASCHASRQNNTLHANTKATCRTCHDTEAWTPASFAHDRLAASAPTECTACHATPDNPLHANSSATCAVCHGFKNWVPATFRHRHISKASRRNCAGCHRDDEPADALHSGTEGPYCGACHDTQAWEPATFDHWRYFALRGEHAATCDTCHRNNDFQKYTCFSCHAHDRRSVRFEHEEENVTADSDCVECHRSGEDD